MGLVEDVDLSPELAGRISEPLAEASHVVDAAITGSVDLDQIERCPLTDGDARRARVTCIAILEVGAVDRLGEDACQRRLAGPAGPDEKDRMADTVATDGIPKRLDDGFLPDDLAEGLRTPAPIERLVRDGRRHGLLGSTAVDRS